MADATATHYERIQEHGLLHTCAEYCVPDARRRAEQMKASTKTQTRHMHKRQTKHRHPSPPGIAHQEKEVQRRQCRSPESELAIDRSRARVLHVSASAGLEPCGSERGRPATRRAEGVWEVQDRKPWMKVKGPSGPYPTGVAPVMDPPWTRHRLRPCSLPARKHANGNGACPVPGQHPLVRPGP